MKKIILDTNMLMAPGQFMVDIFGGIEDAMNEPFILVVLDKTMSELEKQAEGNSKDAKAARLGLALVHSRMDANPTIWEKLLGLAQGGKRLQIVKAGSGYVDDAILNLADADTIVATSDTKLKQRLKKRGIKIAVLKGKNRIVIQ